MNKTKILFVFLVFSIALNVGLFYDAFFHKHSVETREFQQLVEEYPYLSKRVLIELPQDTLINFLELRRALRSEIASYGESQFGVYFEYLPTGTNIGVNDRSEFHAASLFKVPVVMAY